jgi:hypothetical protein
MWPSGEPCAIFLLPDDDNELTEPVFADAAPLDKVNTVYTGTPFGAPRALVGRAATSRRDVVDTDYRPDIPR